MSRPRPLRVAILGSISSGKSTAVRSLCKREGFVPILEPIERWRKSTFIISFYQDMNKYAFPFQNYAFATRLVSYKEVNSTGAKCVVADAHVYTDRHVFAQMLNGDPKFISDEELGWYGEIFDAWEKLVPESDADVYFYLQASPEMCYERIQERIKKEGREEESKITLDYLKRLHDHFERALNSQECKLRNVVRIDANRPEGEVLSEIERAIDERLRVEDASS